MQIAYPNLLFDRNIIDGRGMMCSVLTLTVGNSQGMGGVEFDKIYGIYFSPEFLRLFDGPSCSVMDMTDVSVCTTGDFDEVRGCAGVLHRLGERGVQEPTRTCSSTTTSSTAAA